MKSRLFLISAIFLTIGWFCFADEEDKSTQTQDTPSCCSQTESKDAHKDCNHEKEESCNPEKSESSAHQHHTDVDRRGDEVMGFDHTKTTHHFFLKPKGGIIQVIANDSNDTESRDRIRTHLKEIENLFKIGDFSPAKEIHDREPSGVSTMTRLKDSIDYSYEELTDGARIVIQTKNEEARNAVHEFIKFQIQDHRTGDPLKVQQ